MTNAAQQAEARVTFVTDEFIDEKSELTAAEAVERLDYSLDRGYYTYHDVWRAAKTGAKVALEQVQPYSRILSEQTARALEDEYFGIIDGSQLGGEL